MKLKVGLALGSGGARGWCHIGVLHALAEEGIRPDILCGTSMGSLVAAAEASGILDKLEAFARGLRQLTIARMIDIDVNSGGLIMGNAIMQQLHELGFKDTIAALDRPYMAVATDLYAGREVWMRDGDLLDAVRASIGIPGIFAPVFHNGSWLLDGGMSNPVPVSAARALGAEIIIAVDPNSKLYMPRHGAPDLTTDSNGFGLDMLLQNMPAAVQPALKSYLEPKKTRRRTPGYLEVLSTSIDVMTDQIRRSRLAGEPPNVMVELDLRDVTVLEFSKADLAISRGYAAMKAKMPLLLAQL
ncbi:patatin-like phospholipase family protein [Thalassovita taeanensis]|uniref:NTE family protein n=1 Tax=Thalassovita taeanensis TaxID=657014 RepID=A0A1H8Z1W4_9RHOB|nr:patatin-like phospholipase family protein [Thalassovita taeanensis]SEP58332.1 NTE family protein [Thalassovita taeanensis]